MKETTIKECPFLKIEKATSAIWCNAVSFNYCTQSFVGDKPLRFCPVYELKIKLTELESSIPKKEEDSYNKGYQKGLDESFEKYTKRLVELINDKGGKL